MAQVILACAARERIDDRLSFEPCSATIASIVLFAALSGVSCLTGSTFMLEIHDWVMPNGSVATCVSVAILDVILFGIQQRHHLQSRSGSNRQASARSGERTRLPESSYGRIAEKNRGRASADTFIWRCAVHQRAGPGET